jgi:hypothetical protein
MFEKTFNLLLKCLIKNKKDVRLNNRNRQHEISIQIN